jgi:hypothetical protein
VLLATHAYGEGRKPARKQGGGEEGRVLFATHTAPAQGRGGVANLPQTGPEEAGSGPTIRPTIMKPTWLRRQALTTDTAPTATPRCCSTVTSTCSKAARQAGRQRGPCQTPISSGAAQWGRSTQAASQAALPGLPQQARQGGAHTRVPAGVSCSPRHQR